MGKVRNGIERGLNDCKKNIKKEKINVQAVVLIQTMEIVATKTTFCFVPGPALCCESFSVVQDILAYVTISPCLSSKMLTNSSGCFSCVFSYLKFISPSDHS